MAYPRLIWATWRSTAQDSGAFRNSCVTWRALTAGDWHNLAIKSDGTVVLWGDTTHGNAVPSGLAGASGIAGGGSFCLVIVPNP